MVDLALSLMVSSFIVVGMMLIVLFYVAITLVNYASSINKALSLRVEELNSLRTSLIVRSASYSDGRIVVNVGNVGSTSVLIDSTTTVLIEYVASSTSERVVEILKWGKEWLVTGYLVGSNYFPSANGFVDLKPGATAVIELIPSQSPSPNMPISIVFTTSRGVRVEYVFILQQ